MIKNLPKPSSSWYGILLIKTLNFCVNGHERSCSNGQNKTKLVPHTSNYLSWFI